MPTPLLALAITLELTAFLGSLVHRKQKRLTAAFERFQCLYVQFAIYSIAIHRHMPYSIAWFFPPGVKKLQQLQSYILDY